MSVEGKITRFKTNKLQNYDLISRTNESDNTHLCTPQNALIERKEKERIKIQNGENRNLAGVSSVITGVIDIEIDTMYAIL